MTEELYLIHVLFISACVYFSYKSGEKHGQQTMVSDMLDRKLITKAQLIKEYEL